MALARIGLRGLPHATQAEGPPKAAGFWRWTLNGAVKGVSWVYVHLIPSERSMNIPKLAGPAYVIDSWSSSTEGTTRGGYRTSSIIESWKIANIANHASSYSLERGKLKSEVGWCWFRRDRPVFRSTEAFLHPLRHVNPLCSWWTHGCFAKWHVFTSCLGSWGGSWPWQVFLSHHCDSTHMVTTCNKHY